MLKDSNIDPTLSGSEKKSHDYLKGNTVSMNTFQKKAFDSPEGGIKTSNNPRSSHKIVTPLRKQNTTQFVASLESLFSDSQGVSEQIAKLSNNSNIFKSPTSNLACSFASMCSVNNLTDPSLLQSHVQKSLENSAIGLESPYKSSQTKNNISKPNSLYSTPIRSKQSRSHDFSELPSQRRISRRRSSILAHEDEDLLSILSTDSGFDSSNETMTNLSEDYNFLNLMDELSNFKDNDDDSIANVITNNTNTTTSTITKNMDYNESESEDNSNCLLDYEEEEVSEKRKRPFSKINSSRTFNLPSPKDYQDGSKPPFSYASLIAQAIISNPKQRLALSNIYYWIMETYPFYKSQSCGWQNSIRHNLSLNKCFKKIPRDDDEPGKGAYWTVDLDEMDDFEDGMFKRRRSNSHSSTTSNNSVSNSQAASTLNSPTCNNNAFSNGTGWCSSLLFSISTPKRNSKEEVRTPTKNPSSESQCTAKPMTPLTLSSRQQFKTPIKSEYLLSNVTLTPKIANCINSKLSSPYTSLIPKTTVQFNCNSSNSSTSNCISSNNNNNNNNNYTTSSSAMFWSYPDLSLSQMGLDGEPPLPDDFSEIIPNSILPNGLEATKIPELFKSRIPENIPNEKDLMTRMSPLSWLLNVSSQDSSLGIFDQSQQILSEYLSYNN